MPSWRECLTSEAYSAQIHLLRNGNVCVFSRNCEDRSQAFPDVATAIRTAAEGVPLPVHVMGFIPREYNKEVQGSHCNHTCQRDLSR